MPTPTSRVPCSAAKATRPGQGHGGVITCVAPLLLPDKLLTGSNDKTVRVWDLKTRQSGGTAFPSFNNAVSCMAVSPDGAHAGRRHGQVPQQVRDGRAGALRPHRTRQPPQSISQGRHADERGLFAATARYLAVCSLSAAVGTASRTVTIIDTRTAMRRTIGSSGGPVAWPSRPTARSWPWAAPTARSIFGRWMGKARQNPCGEKAFQCWFGRLAFSPDGKTLASGSADNNVVIWDVPTAEDLMTLKHNGSVEAVQFSQDGQILVTAAHRAFARDRLSGRGPLDNDGSQGPSQPSIGPRFTDRATGLDSGFAAQAGLFGPVRCPDNADQLFRSLSPVGRWLGGGRGQPAGRSLHAAEHRQCSRGGRSLRRRAAAIAELQSAVRST